MLVLSALFACLFLCGAQEFGQINAHRELRQYAQSLTHLGDTFEIEDFLAPFQSLRDFDAGSEEFDLDNITPAHLDILTVLRDLHEITALQWEEVSAVGALFDLTSAQGQDSDDETALASDVPSDVNTRWRRDVMPEDLGSAVAFGFFDDLKEKAVCAVVSKQMCTRLKPLLPCLTLSDLQSMQKAQKQGLAALLDFALQEDMLTKMQPCLSEKQQHLYRQLLNAKPLLMQMTPCLNDSMVTVLEEAVQAGIPGLVNATLTQGMYQQLSQCLATDTRNIYRVLLRAKPQLMQLAPCLDVSMVMVLREAGQDGIPGLMNATLTEDMYDKLSPCLANGTRDAYHQLVTGSNNTDAVDEIKEAMVCAFVSPEVCRFLKPVLPCLTMGDMRDLKDALDQGPAAVLDMALTTAWYDTLSPCLNDSLKAVYWQLIEHKAQVMKFAPCMSTQLLTELKNASQDGLPGLVNAILTEDIFNQLGPCLSNQTQNMYQRLIDHKDSIMQIMPCVNLTLLLEVKAAAQGGKLGLLKALLTPNLYEMWSPCLAGCTRDIYRLLLDARQRQNYALKALDALGKPPSGILGGNVQWLGDMAECRGVQAVPPNASVHPEAYNSFAGKYCTARMDIHGKQESKVRIGVCLPDSCDETSIRTFLSLVLQRVQTNVTVTESRCPPAQLPYTSGDLTACIVCFILAVLLLAGTTYDVILRNRTPKEIKKKIVSVDAINNGPTSHIKSIYDPSSMTSDPEANLVDYDSVELQREQEALESRLQQVEQRTHGHIQDEPTAEQDYKRMRGGDSGSSSASCSRTFIDLLCDILMAFSCVRNMERLLDTSQKSTGHVKAVDGIRVLTSGWVVLGHSFVMILVYVANSVEFVKSLKTFWYQPIVNTALAADAFFVLGGFLVAYFLLNRLQSGKVSGLSWLSFFLHRWWRITPTYLFMLMFWSTLFIHLPEGPLATTMQDVPRYSSCGSYWWTNILYIHNFLPENPSEACMGWSWYLADDMQFFLISPIFIIGLFKLSKVFVPVMSLLITACVVFTGLWARYLERDWVNPMANMGQIFQGGSMDPAWGQLFVRPYHRIAPYLMGMLAAYLVTCRQAKPSSSATSCWKQALKVGFWLLVFLLSAMCVYGMTGHYEFKGHFPVNMSATYLAASRSVFAGCVAAILVACNLGIGGPVTKLLSWKALRPLSRLTFLVYLVHPIVMEVTYKSRNIPYYYTDTEMAYVYIGHLVFSYLAAVVIHLAVEAPSVAIEQFIRRRWNARTASVKERSYCC